MLDSANNKCYITDRTKEGTKKKGSKYDVRNRHFGFLRQC